MSAWDHALEKALDQVQNGSGGKQPPRPAPRHRSLKMSRSQAKYLRELLDDDLATTDLTDDEFEQAEGLLVRLDGLLDTWDDKGENR